MAQVRTLIRFCKNGETKEIVKRIEQENVLSYSLQFRRSDVIRELIQQKHFFDNYYLLDHLNDIKFICPEFERYFFNHCHPELLYIDFEYLKKRMLIIKVLNKNNVHSLSEQILKFLFY